MLAKNLKTVTAILLFSTVSVFAQGDQPTQTLFTNVNVFDGVNEQLIENASVLVEGNMITAVSAKPLAAANAVIIDGGGRTLMPGLIDSHVHLNMYKDGTLVD